MKYYFGELSGCLIECYLEKAACWWSGHDLLRNICFSVRKLAD